MKVLLFVVSVLTVLGLVGCKTNQDPLMTPGQTVETMTVKPTSVLSDTLVVEELAQQSAQEKSAIRDYSQNPPAGLSAAEVPQFVVFGADDCGDNAAVQWIVDYIATKTNPGGSAQAATFDGTSAKMSFYVNGKYAQDAGESWRNAFAAGHEIGNHTYSHYVDENGENIDARLLGDSVWSEEIAKNDATIIATIPGITIEDITGFRTPRLEYNRSAFMMMAKRGFAYECSIEEGGEEGHNGTNNYWPYTMDNGSPADSIMALQSVGESDWGYKAVGKIEGMWQIPVYNYIVPADEFAEEYGFKAGLRARIFSHIDYFDTITGNLTGFDYNIFAPGDWGAAEMSSEEYLAVLKYSFDQHLKGNRTPFTVGMHPDFYTEETDEYYSSAGDYLTRRKIVEDFMTYVLSKDVVRVVTAQQLLQWLKEPVALEVPPTEDTIQSESIVDTTSLVDSSEE